MSANEVELARLWIRKAENDLVTARQTLQLADGPTDTAAFHVQQTVEKALKAMLTVCGVSFQRTHDLVRLLDLLLPFASALAPFRERFAQLSVYAVEIRYPSLGAEPPRDEVETGLATAAEVLEMARRAVRPSDAH